jgi:cation-transporting ATPase 13A2
VIESRGSPLALAVNTGFVTRKGRIFRKILFREHIEPEFYWSALYFLLEMFIYCTIIFLGMIPLYLQKEISTKLMILRFFDMVGWAIPPSFPIIFNVCYSVSLYRFRKQNIFGTEPYKTIVSGKVTVVCFDKTGTLTQNGMELNSSYKFVGDQQGDVIPAQTQLAPNDLLCKLMASCHTVRRVCEEFLGDELDLRMFLYSEFKYEVPLNEKNIKLRLTHGR